MRKLFLVLMITSGLSGFALAQNDTIISKAGDMLIGEIKKMENGILFMDTPYADADFNIQWDEVFNVFSKRHFVITLSDGRRLNGGVESIPGSPQVMIIGSFGSLVLENLLEITYLNPIAQSVIGRLDASIEIGYTFTKAHNHHQFNSRSMLGYTADRWGVSGSLDFNSSVQDSVAMTQRTDATIGGLIFFNRSWYLSLSNNFLQNEEQKLRLRSTTNLTAGRLLINTYRTSWGVGLGGAFNYEDFSTTDTYASSVEALFSTDLNMFAFENISLLTNLKVYPSLTVKGRLRADYKFDIKYDLPLDFFLKFGVTFNYDNQPVEGASEYDYIIQTTVGWEL